jgi:periplasmic divalent cation tolerance protein
MNEILIFCMADSPDLARRIGTHLVENRLAACANILPGVRSIYRWEGKICDEEETLVLIKSTAERFEEIRMAIKSIHSYQVPEIIAVSLAAGDAEYLSWLRRNVDLQP